MAKKPVTTQTQLAAENEDLRARLGEAEETLRAIRSGEVDALVVSGKSGQQLFTLKGADHSFRILVEDMSEGALTLTAEGVILYANRRFGEMLKTTLEKVIGSTVHTWIAPNSGRILQSLLGKGENEKRREQLVLIAGDGTLVPVLIAVSKLINSEMPDSFCVVATDLTEQKRGEAIVASEKLTRELLAASNQSRLALLSVVEDQKRAEDRINQLNNELLQKNAELEQLIYVASHDLRTPLVNVQGFSKELGLLVNELAEITSHAGLPEKQQYRLSDIVTKEFPEAQNYVLASVVKMDALLKGLLKLSRLGRSSVTLQKIDMDEMLLCILKTLEFQIQKSKARIDTAALPSCISDPDQVNQVFTNLIDNAFKFLKPDRPGVILITGKTAKGFSEYCIEDNGIGIAPEHQEKVFEIFQRLDPQKSEGEGLGLAIVKKVVSRLNGSVRLESEVGKGSRFYVSLPGA
jgi:PAS domain S-box-containing protein